MSQRVNQRQLSGNWGFIHFITHAYLLKIENSGRTNGCQRHEQHHELMAAAQDVGCRPANNRQITVWDHFMTDDAPTNVNKGNQRQRRDQSCGQRHSLLLALMINTLPPATSLAVAPEASLEAAELLHCLICSVLHTTCVRQGGGCHKLLLLLLSFYFLFPETQPQHAQRNVTSTWQQTTEHEEKGRDFWLLMFIHKEHHPNTHWDQMLLYTKVYTTKYHIIITAMYIEIQLVKIEMHYCGNVKMHILKQVVCEGKRKRDLQGLQVKPIELQQ